LYFFAIFHSLASNTLEKLKIPHWTRKFHPAFFSHFNKVQLFEAKSLSEHIYPNVYFFFFNCVPKLGPFLFLACLGEGNLAKRLSSAPTMLSLFVHKARSRFRRSSKEFAILENKFKILCSPKPSRKCVQINSAFFCCTCNPSMVVGKYKSPFSYLPFCFQPTCFFFRSRARTKSGKRNRPSNYHSTRNLITVVWSILWLICGFGWLLCSSTL